MPQINWVLVAVSFLGGSTCAFLLRIAYDRYLARAQPVTYEVSTDSVFSSAPHAGTLQAQAQVTHEGETYPFDSLSLVRVGIKNSGNRNLDTFNFGVTVADEHAVVLCSAVGMDRHHSIDEREPKASPAMARQDLDFVCTPLNRRDRYVVRLYIKNKGTVEPQHVQLTTPVPIRFVRTESLDQASFLAKSFWFFASAVASGVGVASLFFFAGLWPFAENMHPGASSVAEEHLPDGRVQKVVETRLEGGGIVRERSIDGDLVERRIVTKEEREKEMEPFLRERYEQLKKRFEPNAAADSDKAAAEARQ